MYDQFYGLQGRPFQLTPDPQFYFESATHRKALSYLGYGLAQGEGFIVITGDIGAGKTTLVGHLMNTIDPVRLTAIKIVSTQVEGDDMLRLAAQGFGIAADGVAKAQLLQRIEQYLHQQARAGRRTLLIVDEAQNLPVSALEELRMLSNFQLGGQSLLQIFLLGQPEFRDLVKSPELEQLRQRVIATHHLEPMMEMEVEPYIVHRLSVVGWTGNPRFTPDAFASIYAATDGVPRRVNALASRVLLMGAIDQLRRIDGEAVDAVAADMGLDVDRRPAALAPSILDDVEEPEAPFEELVDAQEPEATDETHGEADPDASVDVRDDAEVTIWPDPAEDVAIEAASWQAPSDIDAGGMPEHSEPAAIHGATDEAAGGRLESDEVQAYDAPTWHRSEGETFADRQDMEPDSIESVEGDLFRQPAKDEVEPSVAEAGAVAAMESDEMPAPTDEDALVEAEPFVVQTSSDDDEPVETPQPVQSQDQHLLAAMVDEIVRLRTEINALHGAQENASGQPVAEIAALDSRLVQIEERLASLEAGTREQDAALRRVLALLVDWVEREERMADAA